LQSVLEGDLPNLPEYFGSDEEAGDWHPLTRQWWKRAWSSPMAAEWAEADLDGLFVLAVLQDSFYRDPDPKLAAEIRLQRQCFGLTPLDRRRLQWEVERGEQAQESSTRRKVATRAPRASDPRLKAL
jgi:hypothetical protein